MSSAWIAIDISREREMEKREGYWGGNTSEAHAFIVRFVDEELEDLLGHELTRFTNTDRKFTRRTFRDSDVTVILGELDSKGSCNQHLRQKWGRWEESAGRGITVGAHVFQGECQATAIKDDNVALERSLFELCPDAPTNSVR